MTLKSTVQCDHPEEVVAFGSLRAAGFSCCWRKLVKRSWSQGVWKGRCQGVLNTRVY